MRYWSNLSFILQEFRAGRVAKLKPITARAEFEKIDQALTTWEPIVLAACEYFDTVTSELPDEGQRDRLFRAIRESGLVGTPASEG